MTELPIERVLPEALSALRSKGALVLSAPPGSGKTTRLPLALLSELSAHPELSEAWGGERILVLQPRRLAARSVAEYMASLLGERAGGRVGYRVRFERAISGATRVEVLTEGLLTRLALSDPELSGVGCVILDEFHERSLHADLALALLLELREAYRPDLRLVVMSATLGEEAERLSERLSAPLLRAEGRAYPVEVIHEPQAYQSDPCERAPTLIASRWRALQANQAEREGARGGGSLLAFFPGRREIERARVSLERLLPSAPVYPLYGGLKPEQQRAALNPNAPPRIILTTNIAETSVTIEGVSEVIDTGLARQTSYDPKTGLERLSLTPIALDAATQRAGRAGRVRAGQCWRLWSRDEELKRATQTSPEVARADLSATLLSVAAWAGDWRSFAWYERPPEAHLARAEAHLKLLGALSLEGRLTPLGQALSEVSLEPALALSLVYGELCGCPDEVALIATLSAQDRDLLDLPSHLPRALDVWLRVEAFDDASRGRFWSELRRGVFERARLGFEQAKRQRGALSGVLGGALSDLTAHLNTALERSGESLEDMSLERRVALALTLAHPHRVGLTRAHNDRLALLSEGGEVRLPARALEGSGRAFVALGVHQQGREAPRLTLACPVDECWLVGEARDELRLIEERASVCRVRSRWLGELCLEERVNTAPMSDEASALLSEALSRAPWRWLSVSDELKGWLARVRWLQANRAQQREKNTSDAPEPCSPEPWWGLLEGDPLTTREGEAPKQSNPQWSARVCELLALLCMPSATLTQPSLKQLKRVDLLALIKGLTPRDELRDLERSAPERYELPTGQSVRVRYEAGAPPMIEAYLQAFFGEAEHPTLGEGPHATPLQLHLLAPNRRPAQVTSDLPSFWANAYADVRKQLRARYAKHHWPEDPLSMGPQRGAKRRKPS